MSRFPEEVKVIPWGAWVIAVCIGLGFAALLQVVAIPRDPKLADWPEPFALCFSIGMGMFLFIYTLLIGYVNGDARRRGMRYVMWTLLSIFIPNGIGIILYFLLRDPLPQVCPKCGVTVRSKGAFCPACGATLRSTCPACHGALEPGWSHCANCGAEVRRA
ncbi:MAG TPA: zinc ribbon domain-containing protein [Bryobacteraceae bacterium]|nr:zinc ribbon domain-containing protein [Bryobacteraceae bacterium]